MKVFNLILSSLQVKAVVIKVNELISQITADHKIQKKIEEPLSINTFTTNVSGDKSTTKLNGEFVFYEVLIDCLLRLKSTQTDKTELINFYKTEYQGNDSELSKLREFEERYSSNEVLRWYTRDSFFYRTLNAALRRQNIHMTFLFRQFIFDIHRQLKHHQIKSPLRVFRSQTISSNELDGLKQQIGQFISVNSFFSTSTDREAALFFLGDANSLIDLELERVLFEIDADPQKVTTKPFADISKQSCFTNESEVLFMLGSIFRLESINCNDDQIWIIQMSCCSEDEHDLKQDVMHMEQQIGSGETSLRTLGKLLWKMGKRDLAKQYLNRLLSELPSNDPLLYILYEDLGELASQMEDYDMSLQWHREANKFKKKNPLAVNDTSNSTGEFIESNSSIFK